MPNVYVNPSYRGEDRADGGIRRVSDAMLRHLPEFGWLPTDGPDSADLIVNHGTLLAERPGTPMIAACHGLYWHDYSWPLWSEDANRRVIEVVVRSDAITVPSRWVARSIQRGLLRQPHVVYHGVDIQEWKPPYDGPQPYVLWNKARKDAVSDPAPVQTLAGMLPNIPFITTIGESAENVRVIGVQPYEKLKPIVQHARIGLITTRETFGIGTLEMLAAGIPIVGWDYGGQSEIIRPNETGILVPYGDYGALASAVQTVWNDHKRFSNEARQDAIERWQWHSRIQQYAELFNAVVRARTAIKTHMTKVSFVVTCYNLARFLPQALESIAPALQAAECIIVDDCSTDETAQVAREWAQRGNFRYVKTPENLGLSGARNFGAKHAIGEYLMFLDADDVLDRTGFQDLRDALDADTGMHIAYGALDVMDEDGGGRHRNRWPAGAFDWRGQIAHLNQLPYASLMRRSTFDSIGGYRERDWRAEDASFWLRATSFGHRAVRVTERCALVYRTRSGSKSGQERDRYHDQDGDWTAWFPWRLGARDPIQGKEMYDANKQPNHNFVPAGAQGTPPPPHLAWPVRHHADPLVSVIIPVGPGHGKYLVDALDSLIAQTYQDWEAVVVNDSGEELDLRGAPFAQEVATAIPGSGAGKARNVGVESSRGKLLFFLDADDWLRPDALEKMVTQYAREGGYVYSDCVAIQDDDAAKLYTNSAGIGWSDFTETDEEGKIWLVRAFPYDRVDFMRRGYEPGMDGGHTVSVLVAKADFNHVGGFDETIPFWEDWEFMLRLAYIGVCGMHVSEPLLTYRLTTGRRRRASKDVADHLRKILRERYSRFAEEIDNMCGCGGGGKPLQDAAQATVNPLQRQVEPTTANVVALNTPGRDASKGFNEVQKVRLRYVGRKSAPVPIAGRVTGTIYRAARDSLNEIIDVDPRDVEGLIATRQFEHVMAADRVGEEVVTW